VSVPEQADETRNESRRDLTTQMPEWHLEDQKMWAVPELADFSEGHSGWTEAAPLLLPWESTTMWTCERSAFAGH
jgi:hypothetical protein